MPPAAYAKAAHAVYAPQQQAEAIALKSTRDQSINTLESGKGEIATSYQSAIDKLTQAVQDQTGQINQLYSQRLGGNFSGLQGNDLGQMFARSNEQRSIIEQTRANRLATLTTGEVNAKIAYTSGVAALKPKYQSLESEYAQKAYASAVKEARAQANADRTYALQVARFQQSASNSGSAASDKIAAQYKVSGKGRIDPNTGVNKVSTSNGLAFTGPNNRPVNMKQYIVGTGGGISDIMSLLANGDKNNVAFYNWLNSSKSIKTEADVAKAILRSPQNKYFGFTKADFGL